MLLRIIQMLFSEHLSSPSCEVRSWKRR